MAKKRWTTADIEDQTGRVAIVTGGNSGIGFEAAKALAIKGATVVVASRSKGRGEQAVASIREGAPNATVGARGPYPLRAVVAHQERDHKSPTTSPVDSEESNLAVADTPAPPSS